MLLKLTIKFFPWSFHAGYSWAERNLAGFHLLSCIVMILFAEMWTILQGHQSIQGHMTQQCHHHLGILGSLLHSVLNSLFQWRLSLELQLKSLKVIECHVEGISFGQSCVSWWENERDYGLLLFRCVWPVIDGDGLHYEIYVHWRNFPLIKISIRFLLDFLYLPWLKSKSRNSVYVFSLYLEANN